MLVSPDFLFRDRAGSGGQRARQRLSHQRFGTGVAAVVLPVEQLPDDELLDLAEKGKLKDPAVLDQQVRRLLDDPRVGMRW